MTVPTEVSRVDYTGNGSTTAFPVTFPFFEDGDLVVIRTLISTGAEVEQVYGVDYTVTGAGEASGGVVTATVAPSSLYTWSIERTVAIVQEQAFTTQGPFSPTAHEDQFDRVVQICQQLDRRIEALESLGGLIPAGDFDALFRLKTFTTHATAVESGFPVTVVLPADFIPTGVWVVKALNNTDPTDFPEVAVTWTAAALLLTITKLSGLRPNTNYTITFGMVSTVVI